MFRTCNKNNFNFLIRINFKYYSKNNIIRPLAEIPYASINKKKIEFDKNGLYLVAESKSSNLLPKFLNWGIKPLIATIFSVAFFSKIYQYLIFFGLVNYFLVKSLYYTCLLCEFYKIKKIYLSSCLKKVVIQYYFGDYHLKDIKSFDRLNSEQFAKSDYDLESLKKIYSNYIPILIKNELTFIPLNIHINDQEIFTAIINGYYIKLKETEDNKYTKLKTNDYMNYYI